MRKEREEEYAYSYEIEKIKRGVVINVNFDSFSSLTIVVKLRENWENGVFYDNGDEWREERKEEEFSSSL